MTLSLTKLTEFTHSAGNFFRQGISFYKLTQHNTGKVILHKQDVNASGYEIRQSNVSIQLTIVLFLLENVE